MKRKLTLVSLHGFVCDNISSYREAFLIKKELGDILDIDIYAPNIPGHGYEPFENIESIDDLAKDLKAKVDKNVKGPYILIGFSMGGMIALKYAELYETDKSLLGICIWASPLLPNGEALTLGFNILYKVVKITPKSLFIKVKNNKKIVKIMRNIDVNSPAINHEDILKLANILVTSKIDIHTIVSKCFVYGSKDLQVNPRSYQYLLKENPHNSQVHWIKRAGHFGNREGREKARLQMAKYIANLVTNSTVFAADTRTK